MSGGGATLIWAPPVLTNPTTIDVKSGWIPTYSTSAPARITSSRCRRLSTLGTIQINGGHNVVLIGGQITVPSTANQTDNGKDNTDTAIYVKGSTGTVHIEGMLINGQGNTMFDGIDVNAPQATVVSRKCPHDRALGQLYYEHADAIQTWGGVKSLRVDDFTADGDYQGLMVKPDIGSIGSALFRDVDLTADAWPASLANKSSGGGIMVWLTTGTCTTTPMSLDHVYVNNLTNRIPTGNTVWPATNSTTACPAKQTGNAVSWPGLPSIRGSVIFGAPRPARSFRRGLSASVTTPPDIRGSRRLRRPIP